MEESNKCDHLFKDPQQQSNAVSRKVVDAHSTVELCSDLCGGRSSGYRKMTWFIRACHITFAFYCAFAACWSERKYIYYWHLYKTLQGSFQSGPYACLERSEKISSA